MLDAEALLRKHRAKGALVDTNLLVLFLVGAVNRQRILDFKRTSSFTIGDFELLTRLRQWFGNLFATPHVLSQASDLADLSGHELLAVRHTFKILADQVQERHYPSKELTAHPMFQLFGLADAGIATLCSSGVLLVTTDFALHQEVQRRGIDALNFNHVREMAWQSRKFRELFTNQPKDR